MAPSASSLSRPRRRRGQPPASEPTSTVVWTQRSAPVSSLGPTVIIRPPPPAARRASPSRFPWVVAASVILGTIVFLAYLALGTQGEAAQSPPRAAPVAAPTQQPRDDLTRGGVEIRIEEGEITLDEGASAPNPDGVKTTVLCGGLHLYVGPRESATHLILGYLDDD